MDCYAGKCVGGPYDGQMLVHWEKRKKFFDPVSPYPFDRAIVGFEIGEYRINDYNQWHWFATDVGRALETIKKEVG